MTVSNLIEKLRKMPPDAKVCVRGNYLDDVRTVDYSEDYVLGSTYKTVVLNDETIVRE